MAVFLSRVNARRLMLPAGTGLNGSPTADIKIMAVSCQPDTGGFNMFVVLIFN
jgi:hypothetical protein